MISSFYTAATGTIQLQKGVDVVANNIANVSTSGYKPSEPTFSDLVYTNIHAEPGTDADLKSGHGTELAKTDTLFDQGDMKNTGHPLDYALTEPDQFFAVQQDGTVKYTRSGNFHLSVQQDGNYLVDSNGAYVLGADGQPVTMENEQDDAAIGVFSFGNCDGLERDGNSDFIASARSGAAVPVNNPELKKGWLEDSSVNLANEMTSAMELQRAFQFNSKIVQMSDEIMQTVNGLR
jgi:fagellar hook-basal body proteins